MHKKKHLTNKSLGIQGIQARQGHNAASSLESLADEEAEQEEEQHPILKHKYSPYGIGQFAQQQHPTLHAMPEYEHHTDFLRGHRVIPSLHQQAQHAEEEEDEAPKHHKAKVVKSKKAHKKEHEEHEKEEEPKHISIYAVVPKLVDQLEGAFHEVEKRDIEELEHQPKTKKAKKSKKEAKKPHKESVQLVNGEYVNCDEEGHCRAMNPTEKSYFEEWRKEFDQEMSVFSDEMVFLEKELDEMMTEESAKEEKAEEEGHAPAKESPQTIYNALTGALKEWQALFLGPKETEAKHKHEQKPKHKESKEEEEDEESEEEEEPHPKKEKESAEEESGDEEPEEAEESEEPHHSGRDLYIKDVSQTAANSVMNIFLI